VQQTPELPPGILGLKLIGIPQCGSPDQSPGLDDQAFALTAVHLQPAEEISSERSCA